MNSKHSWPASVIKRLKMFIDTQKNGGLSSWVITSSAE